MAYLSNFLVYFLAMIGLIILALYVYKHFNVGGLTTKRSNLLSVEDSLSLSPRKTLFVVREGSERFLIAADMERTTLISKLESRPIEQVPQVNSRAIKGADLSEAAIAAQDNISPMNKPIMREIKNRLKF